MESNPIRKISEAEKIENLQDELESLKELVDGEPDAFLILVGAMKKDRDESGSFQDFDQNSLKSTGIELATGGKDRMLAAAEIHKAFQNSKIVSMSKTDDPKRATYAKVTESELIVKGVDPEQIILEEESVNTITEFIEAAKLWKEMGWSSMAFISSNWHIPRSKALFNHIESLTEPGDLEVVTEFADAIRSGALQIQFIGSTEVLKIRSKHYEQLFEELDNFPPILKRIEFENKALAQIAAGTYGREPNVRQLTTQIGIEKFGDTTKSPI